MTASTANTLVLDFAGYAATAGWTSAALRAFCEARGISLDVQAALWPKGTRSLGRELNDHADAEMMARWSQAPGSLHDVLMARFQDNEPLRAAVRSLATSDLFHPLDTLSRTRKTADLMWACRQLRRVPAGVGGELASWWLVGVYSLCVLVWLADGPARNLTRRAASVAAALCGG